MLVIRTKAGGSRNAWNVGDARPKLELCQLLDIEAICADGEEFDFVCKKFAPAFWLASQNNKEATWFGDTARFIVANL